MMQAIRDGAQGWLAWIIVGFLILVFALFGIQGYVGNTGGTDVAEVNGLTITDRDFENQYRNYRDQQRQQLLKVLGNDVDNPLFKQLFNETVMRKRVLDGMVQSRLLSLAAVKAGFNIGDEQINDIIRQVPIFQLDGTFDKETYKQALRFQGMNNKGFKARLKQDEITAQLVAGLSNSAFVTPAQVDGWLRLQNQQRSFTSLTLKAKDYQHQANIDDDMIKAYYDQNTARFMTEEKVSVDYVELSAANLSEQAAADEPALRAFYEERAADYAVVDTATQAATLNALRKRLDAGEDFAKLAKEASQDSGSANTGGKIGLISRIDMEQAFTDAAFALKKGGVSEPVQTSFGLHIIKVNSIEGEQRDVSHILLNIDTSKLRTRSFEDVRAEIEKEFRSNASERRFGEQFQLLSNISYEQPNTLEPVTTELGLPVKSTENFTRRGGVGLMANPAVITAAFSTDVLAGNNSEPIELADDRVIVLRVKEYQPAAPRPLAEVNDAIIKSLLNDAGQKQVREKAAELLLKLADTGSLSDLAVLENAAFEKTNTIKRTEKKQSRQLVQALFSMKRPQEGKPAHQSVELLNGDISIIALANVEDGDVSKVSSEERLAASKALTQQFSSRDVTALRADLRQEADVIIFEKNNTDDTQP
ncbi:MAG: SurA N-terminal domain-containing protein [Sulfuriflexus sp.]|nr:SurA N-terminal domain-containing protein [Sulfuriflexus sp.]